MISKLIKYFDVLFPKPPDAGRGCKHQNVEWITCHPITYAPIDGKCVDCGKELRARLTWE